MSLQIAKLGNIAIRYTESQFARKEVEAVAKSLERSFPRLAALPADHPFVQDSFFALAKDVQSGKKMIGVGSVKNQGKGRAFPDCNPPASLATLMEEAGVWMQQKFDDAYGQVKEFIGNLAASNAS